VHGLPPSPARHAQRSPARVPSRVDGSPRVDSPIPLDARGAPRTLPPLAARTCAKLQLRQFSAAGCGSPPLSSRARALGRRARREREGREARRGTVGERRPSSSAPGRPDRTRGESAAVGAVEEASAARGKPPPRAGSFKAWTVFRTARAPGRALIRRAAERRPSGRELAAAAVVRAPRRRPEAARTSEAGASPSRARSPPPSPGPTLRRAATSPV
jgi:hypothetical protein